MKTHPLVAHFKDKNLRPFSADADAKLVHIPSLREILDKSGALRAKSIFSDTVFQIVQGSLLGSHPNTEATVLDIRSTDAFSKEKISSLRQIILDKNKLQ